MNLHDQPLQRVACEATAAGVGLKTIRVAPWGETDSLRGKFIVDDEGVASVVAAFERHGVALPIDIEHASIDETQPPEQRGAIGWIEKIFGESGRGLFSLVRWSARGRELIQSDGFRYLSPVLVIDPETKRVRQIHSAALTNKPAIPRMERLAASARTVDATHRLTLSEGRTMELLLKALKDKMGLTEEMTVEQVLEAALARIESAAGDEAIAASVRARLNLDSIAGRDEVILAMAAHEGGGAAASELAAMKVNMKEKEAKALVQGYIDTGYIIPRDTAAVSCAMNLAMEDPQKLRTLMGGLRPIVPQGRTTAPRPETLERNALIRQAHAEFNGSPQNQKLTSARAFVSLALRDLGHAPLTELEAAAFSIPV